MAKVATESKAKVFGSESDVTAALRERFPAPEYALLPGVPDSTGGPGSRTADALIMSCWPSRGIYLMGVEVKVSRSDWLRELKNPAKAEELCRYCDRWYIAAGSNGIVLDGELPPTWGLIEPRGGKLIITKEAPVLKPEPMSRNFLAAILRRASEDHFRDRDREVHDAYSKGHAAGRKNADESAQRTLEHANDQIEGLRTAIKDFQDHSGISIDTWRGSKALGEAVLFVLAGGLKDIPKQFDEARRTATYILRTIEDYQKFSHKFAPSESEGSGI